MILKLSPAKKIYGKIKVPGDKSISHRAALLAAIAEGKTKINNYLFSDDCITTLNCLKNLGVKINQRANNVFIEGINLNNFKVKKNILNCGNSGTTTRLLLGILAGQNFSITLKGDNSLSKRPMMRVVKPLAMMGAEIKGKNNDGYLPLTIQGKFPLQAISYDLPVASAQVKSCLMLAALYAEGETKISEPIQSRDHTERMFKLFNINFETKDKKIKIKGMQKLLSPGEIKIPGDISSAAFFIAAAVVIPNSHLIIENIGLNPTRLGFCEVLKKMGADIKIYQTNTYGEEAVGEIEVHSSELKGTGISEEIIPQVIDEIPLIAVLAAKAQGQTIIRGARELRVKESDRIHTVVTELKKAGVNVQELDDGMIICGGKNVKGAVFNSYNDHRIAMAFSVLSLFAEGNSEINDAECINISFPDFEKILKEIKF